MIVAMEILPLSLIVPVLLIAAVSDLRYLRIPNTLSIAALVLFAGCSFLLPFNEVLARLVAAGVVFAIGFLLFAFRMMGGGDVKLLSALMLFIPSSSLILFGNIFSISMLIGILVVVGLKKLPLGPAKNWASVQQSNTFPMGISIALAGTVHMIVLASA